MRAFFSGSVSPPTKDLVGIYAIHHRYVYHVLFTTMYRDIDDMAEMHGFTPANVADIIHERFPVYDSYFFVNFGVNQEELDLMRRLLRYSGLSGRKLLKAATFIFLYSLNLKSTRRPCFPWEFNWKALNAAQESDRGRHLSKRYSKEKNRRVFLTAIENKLKTYIRLMRYRRRYKVGSFYAAAIRTHFNERVARCGRICIDTRYSSLRQTYRKCLPYRYNNNTPVPERFFHGYFHVKIVSVHGKSRYNSPDGEECDIVRIFDGTKYIYCTIYSSTGIEWQRYSTLGVNELIRPHYGPPRKGEPHIFWELRGSKYLRLVQREGKEVKFNRMVTVLRREAVVMALDKKIGHSSDLRCLGQDILYKILIEFDGGGFHLHDYPFRRTSEFFIRKPFTPPVFRNELEMLSLCFPGGILPDLMDGHRWPQ